MKHTVELTLVVLGLAACVALFIANIAFWRWALGPGGLAAIASILATVLVPSYAHALWRDWRSAKAKATP